jgi:serine protease inhibitor
MYRAVLCQFCCITPYVASLCKTRVADEYLFGCPFQETVSRLTPETLKGVMAEIKSGFYSVDDLTVQLPKFKISQTHELENTLAKLGLTTLFDPISSELGGFIDSEAGGEGHDIPLDSAVHKSFIEVNEEGSEAAAATVLFGFRCLTSFSRIYYFPIVWSHGI